MLNSASNSSKFKPILNERDIRSDTTKIHIFDLSLEQAITLIALHTYAQIEMPKSLLEIDTLSIMPFSPQARYGHYLINQLLKTELIMNSSIDDAFSYNGINILLRKPIEFAWRVPAEYRTLLCEDIREYLEQETLPDPWANQLTEVVCALRLAECQEFFDECTTERHFSVSDTSKHSFTIMLSELLNKYSVAQCQFLILESAKMASDALAKRTCNSYYIIDQMINICAEFINEIKKEKRELPDLKQNLRPIRSMINQVVYEVILPGFDGFRAPLSKLII